MDEPEELISTSFKLYQRHLDLLGNINENSSLALRTVLDSIIKEDKRQIKKKTIDTTILYSTLGLILFLISYLITDIWIKLICIAIGAFLFAYGIIGGVIDGLSRLAKHSKTGS